MSGNLLIVLIVLGGWGAGALAGQLRLPAVLGMTLFGLGLGAFAGDLLPAGFLLLVPYLKSLALVIILLRAGLGLSASALRQSGGTAILLALLPCLAEGAAAVLLYRYWAGIPWSGALAGGTLLAAVSPAVVIPSMLSLRERGFGEERQVPTAVLAGATLDNVVVISLFTLFTHTAAGGGRLNNRRPADCSLRCRRRGAAGAWSRTFAGSLVSSSPGPKPYDGAVTALDRGLVSAAGSG